MDTKEQMMHCATQIEKLNSTWAYGDMRPLLRDIDRSWVTVEHLQATNIVQILYRVLKTCSDAQVKKLIKGILSKWKKRYSQSGKNEVLSNSDCCAAQSRLSNATGQPDSDRDLSRTQSLRGSPLADGGEPEERPPPMTDLHRQPPPENTLRPPTPEDPSKPPSDFPAVRSKCLQLLLAALRTQGPLPPDGSEEECERLAVDVERHIHALHAASPPKYKACVRSKVANLRNPKAAHLRRGLLDLSLAPGEFARMTSEEMACPELRQLRRRYTAGALSERRLPQGGPEGTPTGKLRCRRCEGSDCRVSQLSRGALFLPGWAEPGGPDHDGVTFVTCCGCGEQWYHSGWVCL